MKRLIRTVLWVGLLGAVLWIARSALKTWINGPEVTPGSGGWPETPERPETRPTAEPAPTVPATARPAPTDTVTAQPAPTDTAAPPTGPADTTGSQPTPATPANPAGKASSTPKSTGTRKKASKQASGGKRAADSGKWIVPNGTAEILQTHPVKVKLASRVYRVPGMPMYDRTVADRCYATVEEAEADGFNRAAR